MPAQPLAHESKIQKSIRQFQRHLFDKKTELLVSSGGFAVCSIQAR